MQKAPKNDAQFRSSLTHPVGGNRIWYRSRESPVALMNRRHSERRAYEEDDNDDPGYVEVNVCTLCPRGDL